MDIENQFVLHEPREGRPLVVAEENGFAIISDIDEGQLLRVDLRQLSMGNWKFSTVREGPGGEFEALVDKGGRFDLYQFYGPISDPH